LKTIALRNGLSFYELRRVKGGVVAMGMELPRDWNADVQLAPVGGERKERATASKRGRKAKILLIVLAMAVTLTWCAFLCDLILRLAL
jgi:hypothetical protein